MQRVEGTVVSVSPPMASVEVVVHGGGCGRCHEAGGCGGANISRALCESRRIVDVRNVLNATVGQRVHLGIEEQSLRRVANRAYVFPLLSMLVGAAVGQWGLGEVFPFAGLAGAVIGISGWLLYARKNPPEAALIVMLPADNGAGRAEDKSGTGVLA